VRLLISQNRAIALQRPDRENLVDHSKATSSPERSASHSA
jgi:hypothetical protein